MKFFFHDFDFFFGRRSLRHFRKNHQKNEIFRKKLDTKFLDTFFENLSGAFLFRFHTRRKRCIPDTLSTQKSFAKLDFDVFFLKNDVFSRNFTFFLAVNQILKIRVKRCPIARWKATLAYFTKKQNSKKKSFRKIFFRSTKKLEIFEFFRSTFQLGNQLSR